MLDNQVQEENLHYKGIIEAVLFAAGEPVHEKELQHLLAMDADKIERLMNEMAEDYLMADRGLRLVKINETWQLSSKPEYYDYIKKVVRTQENSGLSKAALETLAIIAYRQPITRIEIDNLRGVSSNSSVQRLLDRGLIKEAGRMEAPGRPILYKTTPAFLKIVQLDQIDKLPSFDSFSEAQEFIRH